MEVFAPVVGDVADDREPGAAVGAVDEGVAVTAVFRVVQLPQAVVTGRDVGGDEDIFPAFLLAGDDAEGRFARGRRPRCSKRPTRSAAGGRPFSTSEEKFSILPAGPSTSTMTPSVVLQTNPPSRCFVATR